MTDAQLIAAFLASKKPTVIPAGVRTTTDQQLKRRVGHEPEKVYHFTAMLRGEDGKEFRYDFTAANKKVAAEVIAEAYPEAAIDELEYTAEFEERREEVHAHYYF